MADINAYINFLFKWEGRFANVKGDAGGPTNMGVTLKTWNQCGYDKTNDGRITVEDLKLITRNEVVEVVLKPHYWDRWQADRINSQALANMLVDWLWTSGKWGIILPQMYLQVLPDGIVGEKTIAAVNTVDPMSFFLILQKHRREYLENIVRYHKENAQFLRGWLTRLYDLKYIVDL